MKLSGIFAAITTPFDHNGEIYRTKIEHNLSRWNATSLAGYVVGGHAGEGLLLSHAERLAVFELSAKNAGEGRTLIADVTVEGAREAMDLAAEAGRLGYHAVTARPPAHYRHVSVPLFFQALADKSPLPVIVCGDEVDVTSVSSHPNIAAAVRSTPAEGCPVLIHSAENLWKGLKGGAPGAILDFAAAAPYAAIAVWEAFRTREDEAGQDWQNRITRPSELVTEVYGVAGLKYAMDLNGYYGGPPRLPLTPLTGQAKEEIAAAFEGFSGKT